MNKKTEISGASAYPSNRLGQRERKVLQVSDQYEPINPDNWAVQPEDMDDAIDMLAEAVKVVKAVAVVYDFSIQGGTVGDLPLGVTLPDNAIIVEVLRDETTSATSGGALATIQLSVPTDGALEQTGLVANGGAPSLANSGGSALPKKLTAERELQVTIAVEAVTAGKVHYYIRYYIGT